MKFHLLFLILSLFLVGCSNSDDTTTGTSKTYYYDPRLPYGTITTPTGLGAKLLNVSADTSQLNRIILNWTVPPLYQTMDYKVKIYKKRGDDSNFILPDPADEASGAILYLRTEVQASTFVDQDYRDAQNELVVQVEAGATYTYWLYVNVDDKWSDGIKVVATARTAADAFTFPNASKFWEYLRWSLGNPPTPPSAQNPASIITLATINDYSNGQKTFPYAPEIGKPVGGVALAYSGNVMYYADTANNRVIIYTRGLAYSCDQYKVSDPELYLACTYQYASAPLTAVNILGQDSHYNKKTCNDYNNICATKSTQATCESASTLCSWKTTQSGGTCSAYQKCLNSPTKVTVADNKLFISDSGNNRIVVYDSLPTKGCDKEILLGSPQPVDCNPSWVIGKQGLDDLNNYPISNSSLDFPTGIATKDNNLYIADTNNNRVVMIKDYNDRGQFDCSDPVNWNQALCSFTSVLGQKDFTSKWSFKEGSNDGTNTTRDGLSGYDGLTCPTPTSLNCTSPFTTGILNDSINNLNFSRQFRKPVEVKFSTDGKLMVSANEEFSVLSTLGTSQIRGRILIWNTNPMLQGVNQCNPSLTLSELDSDSDCMASKIIGQELPNKLIVLNSSAKYRDSAFGLDSVDSFDLKGNLLVSADLLNNYVYQWNDFTLTPLVGTPATAKIVNPEGRLDNTTGTSRYLPNLQAISDIKISPNTNLIFVSDPYSSKVHEIRAYEYETPQN